VPTKFHPNGTTHSKVSATELEIYFRL